MINNKQHLSHPLITIITSIDTEIAATRSKLHHVHESHVVIYPGIGIHLNYDLTTNTSYF